MTAGFTEPPVLLATLPTARLVLGNEVHPYHLLRYDRAIFSRPALEKLQDSLKKSVSKRRHEEVA